MGDGQKGGHGREGPFGMGAEPDTPGHALCATTDPWQLWILFGNAAAFLSVHD